MSSTLQGTCLCGACVFEVSGAIPAMYKCYCTLCQKQSGTASNAATIVRTSAFAWVKGYSNVTRWKKASGFSSHFCTTCGSPVPNPIGDGFVWIPMGLMQELDPDVVVALFGDTKPAWETRCASETALVKGVDTVAELHERLSRHQRT